ncbi:hypothetical protein BaRGS_00014381 [Batillaria attramentaria]|uniref:Uncharacterized protein n=1 Tax=Batillaria attramentaria TaxID=370345 RepID=A0ABD0L4L2_9CAEN
MCAFPAAMIADLGVQLASVLHNEAATVWRKSPASLAVFISTEKRVANKESALVARAPDGQSGTEGPGKHRHVHRSPRYPAGNKRGLWRKHLQRRTLTDVPTDLPSSKKLYLPTDYKTPHRLNVIHLAHLQGY